ncbi:retrovirus-related pol polyprotein from transposon TNT 1-94, partial [Tanacetum coccineum]
SSLIPNKPQKERIIVDVSPRQAYLLCRVVLSTFLNFMGSSTVVAKRLPLKVGRVTSEIKETFVGGNRSSPRSSWYWTYSSIRFQPSSLVRELKRKFWKRIQALLMDSSVPCFNQRTISLRDEDLFKDFDNGLHSEINEVKTVFNQMEAVVEQKYFDIQKKEEKRVIEKEDTPNKAKVITPGLFKLDLEPLSPKVLKNKDAHIDYIKHIQENTYILRELVEHARALRPLDSDLDSACKYAKRIQEVLVYVTSIFTKPSEKLVAITSLNKSKKVRFAEHATSSSTNKKQIDSYKTQDSKKLVLPSTGMKSSTSVSRLQPSGNTKNNRILQTTSSNMKNKVQDHPRSVKSSSNKMNRISELVCNADIKHTSLNANSELICVICNQCMFDANHDVYFLEFVNDVVQIVLWYLDSGCSKHMTGNRSQLVNFVHKFLGTVRFGNDQIAKIIGYGDYQMGNVTIYWVYYVEGPGHNLFSIGQFCDLDLDVTFRKHTCYIRDLEGVDLLKGLRGSNLYTLSLEDMMLSLPIYLLSKASKTNKKHIHKPKAEDTIQEKLYLLHMDLCGPMRIQSINRQKYILVIVDDYSRITWVKFLRTKDEVLEFVIKFLKMIQVRLNATVRNIRTDNGTEFINQTIRDYYEDVGISHQTFVEAVATSCYTQNRSINHKCHNKIPYELLQNRKSDLSYLHVFGALCYPTNDSEDLGKLKPKADIGIFVGYAPPKKA